MSNYLLQRKVSDSQLETVILSIDNLPLISSVIENSTAPITSGAVFSALALKQNTLTAGNGITITDSTIAATVPTASTTTLGGVKIGDNLTITTAGVLNATDTTYKFTGGTNSFVVTPSNGTAQTVTVTPQVNLSDVTGILPVSKGGTGNSSIDDYPLLNSTKMVPSKGISKYIASRGQNLLTNGTALLGTNFNFSALIYDGSDTYYAGGCFKSTRSQDFKNDEYIPVDINQQYKFTYYIKSSSSAATYYDMIRMFDIDYNEIVAETVMFMSGTLTTLAADLNDGDTTITLTDASGWNNTTTAKHQLGVIFWNYSNSYGYTYPAETYSRNRYLNIFATGAISGNVITLKSAWTYGTVAAGTQLSQSNSGGTYQYLNGNYTLNTDTWTLKTGILSGVAPNNAGGKFRYGTAFVKIGYLINYNNIVNTTTKLSTLSFGLDYASKSDLDAKQDTLVSGTNIKTINNTSILGSGNFDLPVYSLPTASTTTLGGVKIDGSTITITNGVIKANYTPYTLPVASATTLGGVKIGSGITITDGVISAGEVVPATTTILGGIKLNQVAADATINTASTITNRFYPINLTTAGIAYVNIPWTDTTYSAATTSADGLMSSADKTKLNGIATGATNVVVDSALSATSTNAIQNSVVNTALATKQNTLTAGNGITITDGVISAKSSGFKQTFMYNGSEYAYCYKGLNEYLQSDDISLPNLTKIQLNGVDISFPYLVTSENTFNIVSLLRSDSLFFYGNSSFTLTANPTKTWNGTLEWSNNNGSTWSTISAGSTLSGTAIYVRGTGNTYLSTSDNARPLFSITGSGISVAGNIENILDYATVALGNHPTMASYCYHYMFYGCTSLVSAPSLPATTLADNCYYYMFTGCTSLVSAPSLPATTLADYCYYNMFARCTSLVSAPSLPATTLAGNCYAYMFHGCTSLVSAPSLPATTSADYCYYFMFNGCTSLVSIPSLPATTLADYCYYVMFDGCTKIKLSTTQTGEYQNAYRIPTTGTGTTGFNSLTHMFYSTGGTYTSTPSINTTYYTSNLIV